MPRLCTVNFAENSLLQGILAVCLTTAALSACGGGAKTEDGLEGLRSTDADRDGFPADEDCNDHAALIHPDAVELCDGSDNNCDGQVDEGALSTWYLDEDGDGFGDPLRPVEACVAPARAARSPNDCADADPTVYPGAVEACDGVDNDCDGVIDEGGDRVWYRDADGDGYGDAAHARRACAGGADEVERFGDCDDSAADVFPGAAETCNRRDDDCDGAVDESDAIDAVVSYRDVDADGYGDPAAPRRACEASPGYVDNSDDCDDLEAEVSPEGVERCNLRDDDCNGATDEVSWATSFTTAPAELRVNGAASFTSGLLQLTPAAGGIGTAFLLDPIPGDRFRATFRFSIGGGPGDGGDGLAFVFLDSTDATQVGRGSSEIGYGGMPGYAVEVDTYNNSGWDPTGNHVAVMNAATLGNFAGNNDVPIFENTGWHTMIVEFTSPRTRVWVDGVEVIDVDVFGYPTDELLLGFTAATGVGRNYHRVDDLVLDCP